MISPETLAAGERISIALHPNHDILDTDAPEYRESYNLPFAFSDGQYVTGITYPCHFLLKKQGEHRTVAFTYTNSMDYYAILFPSEVNEATQQIGVKFMSIHQYRSANFLTRPAGDLVFEVPQRSGTAITPRDHGLSASIARGEQHYLVIQLNEHRTWMVPVDITYDYYDEGRFEFRTQTTLGSVHAISPGGFRDSLMNADPDTMEKFKQPQYGFLQSLQMVPTYLRVLDDGTFYTATGERTGTASEYHWLKVFAYP